MGSRVILIKEKLLTEDLLDLKNVLDKSIKTIKRIRNGIDEDEFKNAIQDIEDVSEVLKCLSQKKFLEALIESVSFDKLK